MIEKDHTRILEKKENPMPPKERGNKLAIHFFNILQKYYEPPELFEKVEIQIKSGCNDLNNQNEKEECINSGLNQLKRIRDNLL